MAAFSVSGRREPAMLRRANMARYRSNRGTVGDVRVDRRESIWDASVVAEGVGKEGGAGSTEVNCLKWKACLMIHGIDAEINVFTVRVPRSVIVRAAFRWFVFWTILCVIERFHRSLAHSVHHQLNIV